MLADVNDEPPRFVKKEWYLDVEENDSEWASQNVSESPVLLRLVVQDNDLPETNQFHFRIVNEKHTKHFEKKRENEFEISESESIFNYSGHFMLTAVNTHMNTIGSASASLRLTAPLDYEQVTQRFLMLKVLVTDKGDDFSDSYHRDACFVYIKVRDTNDNIPKFSQSFVNVSLPENALLGTIITKFFATDADQNGHSQVLYSLDNETNRRRYFSIDSEGFVRLNRQLDRETIVTHIVKVLATDTDEPRLTSTATLVVNVEDINDNAPRLVNNTLPPIIENSRPSKLGELFAYDLDDYSKGNGPPFTFFLSPDANEEIKHSFRLEAGFKGEGKAILYSNVVFDREAHKQYFVPVVVRDSGYPSLSSTCTVTITVGDQNDNTMKDGWKDVTVFYIAPDSGIVHMQRLYEPIKIGSVNVNDPDDWDSADKTFYWSDHVIDSKFILDTKSGMVSMKTFTKGEFELKFSVHDRRHQHQVHSTMRVQVQPIPLKALVNSGSLRIVGLDSFQFVATWDWKIERKVVSLMEKLQNSLQLILGCDVVQTFSIMDLMEGDQKALDIRYYAKSKDRFLSSVYLNGIVQVNRDLLVSQLAMNVSQIGINQCMHEEKHLCEATSCFTEVTIDWTNPSQLVQANFSSFVGIRLFSSPKCTCFYHNLLSHFDHQFHCDIDQTLCSSSHLELSESCHLQDKLSFFTRNYQTSITSLAFDCINDRQLFSNSRSFKGDGWIWLEPLPVCASNYLSVQIITTHPNGIILFYGPLSKSHSKDFMLLELVNGKVRLLFDFGAGIHELSITSGSSLSDGIWHQIDVHFEAGKVFLILDTCTHSVQTRFEGVQIEFDRCHNFTHISSFNEQLNVNGPLQIGGIFAELNMQSTVLDLLRPAIHDFYKPTQNIVGFTGCVRNLVFNGHIYDLIEVHHSHNSYVGCLQTNSLCTFMNKKCHHNGFCESDYHRARCICKPGYHGEDCSKTSEAVMFRARSFMHLSIIKPHHFKSDNLNSLESSQEGASFENGLTTKIDVYFRTRQSQAEVVRLSGKNPKTFCIVEIREARITFRFNLNPLRAKSEKVLSIESFVVNDGKWHRVQAHRFGESAFLTLDSGGIGKFARLVVDRGDEETHSKYRVFDMNEHQILLGGQVHYLAIGATNVVNDFVDGCLKDLKINEVHISLSDLLSRSYSDQTTEPAFSQGERTYRPTDSQLNVQTLLTKFQNVIRGCASPVNVCSSLHCAKPLQCVDEWMVAKCRCPTGFLLNEDGTNCTKSSNELCKTNRCLCRQYNAAIHNKKTVTGGIDQSAKLSRLYSFNENDTDCHSDEEQVRQPTVVNARIFQLEYGLFVIVLLVLVPLNIPLLLYIAYVCCRNKRSNSANTDRTGDKSRSSKSALEGTKSSFSLNDDIRENIVCYRDEGGGEDDVRAYDMIALRIAMPNCSFSTANANCNGRQSALDTFLERNHTPLEKHDVTFAQPVQKNGTTRKCSFLSVECMPFTHAPNHAINATGNIGSDRLYVVQLTKIRSKCSDLYQRACSFSA